MSDVQVVRLKESQISSEWGTITRLLSMGEEYWNRHYTLEGLRTKLLEGHMQFWYAKSPHEFHPFLGGLTQIEQYEFKRVLRIVWLGGQSLGPVDAMADAVETWARELECQEVEIAGRDAFVRLMAHRGYVKTHVVIRKEL